MFKQRAARSFGRAMIRGQRRRLLALSFLVGNGAAIRQAVREDNRRLYR